MISEILFILAAAIGVEWGVAENRLFSDKPMIFDQVILNHFKAYHVFMGVLFGTINLLATVAICPNFTWYGLGLWIWLMIWDTLILDVTWWIIRFFDFKFRPAYALQLYFPETNAWHEQADWDNWLNPPLVFGCYWWWWVFGGILSILGAVIWLI
jgi:hypothetical protein